MGAVMVVVALAMLRQLRHPLPEHDRQRPAELPRQPDRRASRTPPRPRQRWPTVRGESAHGDRRPKRERSGAAKPSADGRRPPRTCRCSARRRNSSTTSSWFNTPGDRPLTLQRAARPGRPGRLLDLQLHQLPAHPALPEGLGRALPQGRADDRRRPHARVPLRARRRQRRRSDRATTASTTRSPRTTNWRPGTPTATSTGRPSTSSTPQGKVRYVHFGEGEYGEKEQVIRELLAEAGDAGRRRRRPRSHAIAPSAARDHAGDLPRRRPRRTLHQPDALAGPARLQRAAGARRRTNSPTAGAGGSRSSRRPPSAAPRSTSTSAPGASTWCSARRAAAARMRVLLDGQPISARRRRHRRPRRRRRPSTGQRLYNLVDLPRVGHHVLTPGAGSGGDGLCLHLRLSTGRATIAAMAETRARHRAGRRRRADDRRGRRPLHGAGRLRDPRAPPTGREALRLAERAPARPGRARPDAAGDRRDRGDAAAARAARAARSR